MSDPNKPMTVTITEECDRCFRRAPLELTLAQASEVEAKQQAHEEELHGILTLLKEQDENGKMPDLLIYYKGEVVYRDKVCTKCDNAVQNNIVLARGLTDEEKAEKKDAAETRKAKKAEKEAKAAAEKEAAEAAKVAEQKSKPKKTASKTTKKAAGSSATDAPQ